MAEILTSLVGPVMEELGKKMVATVKHQFNYLCCFNNNIQNLNEEAQELHNARVGLQMQVDTDRRNTKDIVPEVTKWLDASNKIQVKTSGIEVEIKDVKSGCLAIKSRYLISRKAKKTAQAIKDLRDNGKFLQISVSAPPASMAPIPLGATYEFETRKQIENEIMDALTSRKVNVMGICGMGGVGKTTMAKRILKRVMEENLFDEVVMVAVRQEVEMSKIQCEIAGSMGLNSEEESMSARAKKIHDRLMQTKRFLLILDDVWGRLEWEVLGIPCESDLRDGCAIVLTSRSRDVLIEMDAQNIYAVKVLSETEAWFLFKEKVGTCVDELNLLSIAKEVAEECKGLPLALITVGRTLKDKRNQRNWKCALKQLKSANPIDMPHVLADVYNPIKLSYDFLESQRAKSLFLLCCLFPEDHDIDLEYLALYGLGLGTFEEIRCLEEVRDVMFTLLEMLKSSFLLLDGSDEFHVKMHDVVRDVAIFIASSEGRLNLNFGLIDYSREQSIDCTWVSVVGRDTFEFPIQLSFPNLRLLMIDNLIRKSEIEISNPCFFQGMKELKVLSLVWTTFRSLPRTIKLLQNLRTLSLEYCTSLETISILGELLSLKILIFRSCYKIEELPVEIGRLNQLKLLEVSHCACLRRIVPGVISNLVQLEELKIMRSFTRWETKGNERKRNNASIGELELLSNLTSLEIEIEDSTLATEEICLPPKIMKYHIGLAERWYTPFGLHKKSLHIELDKEITLGKWIQGLLRSTEYLFASGDGSIHLDIAQAQKMKTLAYKDCSTMNKLTTSMDWSTSVFPLLESLNLSELHNLEELCDGPIPKASNSFGNLKELTLNSLPALLNLWKSPHQSVSLGNLSSLKLHNCGKLCSLFLPAKDGLLQLENLEIKGCEMMEHVFCNEENEKDEDQCHITFPKLKKLVLCNMPWLTTFCKGSESIGFPMLELIDIRGCPKLTSLVSRTRESLNLEGHDGDSFHVLCYQKVSFGSLNTLIITTNISNIWCHQISLGFFNQLEHLSIYGCTGIRSLFSFSIAENLFNLKTLDIRDCKEMVTLIENEEILCEKPLQFSSLRYLQLTYLPKLQSFFRCKCDLQLPLLKDLSISGCPLLKFLTKGSCVIFSSLKQMLIDEYNYISPDFFSQLEKLQISHCNDIRSLFSFSIAKNLLNLKELDINACNEMVTVIEDHEEMLCENRPLLFPGLKILVFSNVPKLQSFCKRRCDIQLPSLEIVQILMCPLLEFLTMGSIITPNLRGFDIDCEKRDLGDLNGAIQLHFKAKQKIDEINEESISANEEIEDEEIEEETNEETSSFEGTNGEWGQNKDLSHDEINQISERERVIETLELFPLTSINTEADNPELRLFIDEEIDHPIVNLQLKL